MSQITPQLVKELREKTGAGMGDCKSALTETNGDLNAAIEILRKKGAASAAKRADRSANEGIIGTLTTDNGKTGVMVEINCETDFVARNENFINYVDTVTNAYLNNNVNSSLELMNLQIGSDTIQGLHNEILAKFSERIEVGRIVKVNTTGFIASYLHAGSKLGVLVETNIDNPSDTVKAKVRDIAMQIAAMNPQYISRDDVDTSVIEKEIEIYKEVAIKEGKKPEIAERIATGKLEKFYQESCLIEQTFVKDPNKTIKDVLADISAETGNPVTIVSFNRFFLGEA